MIDEEAAIAALRAEVENLRRDETARDDYIRRILDERDAARTEVERLTRERDEANERATAAHRRAQAVEGAHARCERMRAAMPVIEAAAWDRARREGQRSRGLWRDRYRAAVRQLQSGGVDARVYDADGTPIPNHIMGRLDTLITRVLAERDEARADAAKLRSAAQHVINERSDNE